jgi:hypothetical protein
MWGKIGVLLSAWIKVGLVLLFGLLCFVATKLSKPEEEGFTYKILRGLTAILIAYYSFVVGWNILLIFIA